MTFPRTIPTVLTQLQLSCMDRKRKKKVTEVGTKKKKNRKEQGWFPASSRKAALPLGEDLGGGGGRWGQRLSIEGWFMIRSVLHVCSQVSGSYTQLEQQGLGVCFSEDKLKLDTFISASATEQLVTADQKSFPLISHHLKMWEIVTVCDKQRKKIRRRRSINCLWSTILNTSRHGEGLWSNDENVIA